MFFAAEIVDFVSTAMRNVHNNTNFGVKSDVYRYEALLDKFIGNFESLAGVNKLS